MYKEARTMESAVEDEWPGNGRNKRARYIIFITPRINARAVKGTDLRPVGFGLVGSNPT